MTNATNIDFSPVTKTYHTELKNCKPIKSRTREKQLLIKAKKGDSKAQNELLTANLRFVFNMAKKYRGYGIPMEELISEGNVALIYAIKKFDVENNVKFITYASYWVRYYMSDYIKKRATRNSVEKNEDAYLLTYKNYEDSCSTYDIEDEKVKPLDSLFPEYPSNKSPENEKIQNDLIEELLGILTDRERKIIECYYGLGNENEKNLEEISGILKISRERVRQIKENSLIKMKSEVMLMDNFDNISF